MKKPARQYEPLKDYTGYDTRLEWPSGELAALIAARALPRGRALDLGCGHGTEALMLADHGWEVVGVDTDEEAVAAARLRAKRLGRTRRIRFVRASALTYRPPDGELFDVVLERLLYGNFVPDTDFGTPRGGFPKARRDLITTIARSLRPGGVAVMRFHLESLPATGRPTASMLPFSKRDASHVRRFFALGPPVGFVSVAGDGGRLTDVLVPTPVQLVMQVLTRNYVPVP